MTHDYDTRREPQGSRPLTPIEEVYRALTWVQTECEQLDAAAVHQDVSDAEIAAADAVASLLVAWTVLRKVDEMKEREQLAFARNCIGASHRKVIDQFAQTMARIDSSRLHRLLLRLRFVLALSHGEPPLRH